tara:strand:+ start:451 stop:1218 length:768 start_codon:yes stop_codon:yes gene_type:complete
MKVLILAGGFGTRLSEYTNEIPKPMVPIGNIPIIVHIMSLYAKYGYKEFVVATGYKSNIINDYFKEKSKNIKTLSEIKVELEFQFNANNSSDVWKITLLYTGEKTMTGGRVKRAKDEIKESKFLMTYGDGISNIRIDDLVDHHSASKKLATLSAVRPPVRFGELELDGINVTNFAEKPRLQKGWINGGFFVFERDIFDFIGGDEIMLEREPLEKLVEINQLVAYKHNNFWQCMDTKRDKDTLEEMWISKKIPWLE